MTSCTISQAAAPSAMSSGWICGQPVNLSMLSMTSSRLPRAGTDTGCRWGITEAMLVRSALYLCCLCLAQGSKCWDLGICFASSVGGSSLGQVRSDVGLFEERSLYFLGRLRRVCPQACLLLKTGETVAFSWGREGSVTQ